MIKVNVITSDINWYKYIKNPITYLDRKINKINSNNRKITKTFFFCTLLLSGSKEIKHLNKKFRKKNKTTDVLSFPFHTKKELKKNLKIQKEIYIGDIIINLDKLKNKRLSKEFKYEFDRLWIHGLVHLFGHDHKKNKDFKKMIKIEKQYFHLINV